MSQLVSSGENSRDGLSGWQLALSLFSGRLMPGNAWRRRFYRYKFMLRYLTTHTYSGPWLEQLAKCPLLTQMLASQPGLPCKLHRPYLAANMSAKKQLAALGHHYDYIQSHLPRPLLEGHLSRDGFTLASLLTKNERIFHLRLCSLDQLNREGEATLLFCDDQNVMLAEMTFVITPERGATLFIGGLQGGHRQLSHDTIHSATKACHGLFPKRLVLEAVTLLGKQMGVSQILAVGNRTHMYQEWRYFYKNKRFLHADYDNFWLSMHGQPQEQGYFRLPLSIPRKSLTAVPSKKRAEYRRRYGLLDQLAEQVTGHFQRA
ncbi:VirK/YbjX family protein [Sodalis sp. dw_96]|uniref:VirK/YbjX family protein n=1 Tax=Sodalis sp. dw_96 TaxID=2719794 RepID=UPI001BD503D9|nr:VirK/YbjX family protein [Sodalis sp. dw_96]